jgi:uncharacterized protein
MFCIEAGRNAQVMLNFRIGANAMMPLPPKTKRLTERFRAAGLWRPALICCGWLFLGVGIAGLILPLLPGTVFLILSAACFSRSSPKFENWLLDHPRLGPPVRQWRKSGSIPRRIKAFACLSLVASWFILLTTNTPSAAKAACLVIFCAVAVYIGTRPEN